MFIENPVRSLWFAFPGVERLVAGLAQQTDSRRGGRQLWANHKWTRLRVLLWSKDLWPSIQARRNLTLSVRVLFFDMRGLTSFIGRPLLTITPLLGVVLIRAPSLLVVLPPKLARRNLDLLLSWGREERKRRKLSHLRLQIFVKPEIVFVI